MKDYQGYADFVSSDGKFRYKIGIIDFLTKYTGLKYIENVLKSSISGVESI